MHVMKMTSHAKFTIIRVTSGMHRATSQPPPQPWWALSSGTLFKSMSSCCRSWRIVDCQGLAGRHRQSEGMFC